MSVTLSPNNENSLIITHNHELVGYMSRSDLDQSTPLVKIVKKDSLSQNAASEVLASIFSKVQEWNKRTWRIQGPSSQHVVVLDVLRHMEKESIPVQTSNPNMMDLLVYLDCSSSTRRSIPQSHAVQMPVQESLRMQPDQQASSQVSTASKAVMDYFSIALAQIQDEKRNEKNLEIQEQEFCKVVQRMKESVALLSVDKDYVLGECVEYSLRIHPIFTTKHIDLFGLDPSTWIKHIKAVIPKYSWLESGLIVVKHFTHKFKDNAELEELYYSLEQKVEAAKLRKPV